MFLRTQSVLRMVGLVWISLANILEFYSSIYLCFIYFLIRYMWLRVCDNVFAILVNLQFLSGDCSLISFYVFTIILLGMLLLRAVYLFVGEYWLLLLVDLDNKPFVELLCLDQFLISSATTLLALISPMRCLFCA